MKYQLVCPKCKHEFTYNGGEIDAKIERLKVNITQLRKWIADYKLMSRHKQQQLNRERSFKVKELADTQLQLQALKARRKAANQYIQRSKLEIYAQLVRDEIGEQRHKELMEQAEQELKAYELSGLMWHEYTRASSKGNVTSINKL